MATIRRASTATAAGWSEPTPSCRPGCRGFSPPRHTATAGCWRSCSTSPTGATPARAAASPQFPNTLEQRRVDPRSAAAGEPAPSCSRPTSIPALSTTPPTTISRCCAASRTCSVLGTSGSRHGRAAQPRRRRLHLLRTGAVARSARPACARERDQARGDRPGHGPAADGGAQALARRAGVGAGGSGRATAFAPVRAAHGRPRANRGGVPAAEGRRSLRPRPGGHHRSRVRRSRAAYAQLLS